LSKLRQDCVDKIAGMLKLQKLTRPFSWSRWYLWLGFAGLTLRGLNIWTNRLTLTEEKGYRSTFSYCKIDLMVVC